MGPTITLRVQNKEEGSGYKSDFSASLIIEDKSIKYTLCSFGLDYRNNIEDQCLYIAKCFNHVAMGNTLSALDIRDGIDASKIVSLDLVNSHIKTSVSFGIVKYDASGKLRIT